MSTFVIALLAFAATFICTIAFAKARKSKAAPQRKEADGEEWKEPSYLCSIAGAQYHNTRKNIGAFLGTVQPDPGNEHDPNAIAIYDGKRLVGFIPRAEQADFREWADKPKLLCVGFIQAGDDVPLYGKVKVLDCSDEQKSMEVLKFVRWMVDTFGIKFIPDGFTVDGVPTPTTAEGWVAVIDTVLKGK
jgi:hypothetical protein